MAPDLQGFQKGDEILVLLPRASGTWLTVLAVTAAQFAVTYLPPLQNAFGTQAVPFLDGLIIVAAGAMFFAIIEAEKQLRLAYRRMV